MRCAITPSSGYTDMLPFPASGKKAKGIKKKKKKMKSSFYAFIEINQLLNPLLHRI